jgi:hypothetical protein
MITPDTRGIIARDIMLEFAETTGLSPEGAPPERYLWTDAFAVCNFLGLYRQTADKRYKHLALLLVEQVHNLLGRHRPDDRRTGWISGLGEEEGKRHPTRGGLRIGKKLRERRPEEPFDRDMEWDRDGQYFHYLTQWMHALYCVSRATGDLTFHNWARELAKAAHAGFSYVSERGDGKRLCWKMSIDLSRPLVSSMGHHDPLDGLITYSEIQTSTGKLPGRSASRGLAAEIADMAAICKGKDWATDDPLGIGGMLISAFRMALLILQDSFVSPDLLHSVLEDSLRSLDYFESRSPLNLPADYRLAFREFGLSIGLQAIQKLKGLADQHPEVSATLPGGTRMQNFGRYVPMSESINAFWLDGKNRQSATWEEHRTINMVMLATSLFPDGYLLPQ